MKVYISVDIEGVAGITHWNEAEKNHPDYAEFREQMTREAAAACEGAFAAGATEVLVKDAHDSGRNLFARAMPARAKLIRAWAGHPFCMVQELDESFAAVMMIGYHCAAGSEGNALAHTLSLKIDRLMINERPASEFLVHAKAAALKGVPVVLVAGDEALMQEVKQVNPSIHRCATKRGVGQSTVSLSPDAVVAAIRAEAEASLKGDLAAKKVALADRYKVELRYNDPVQAYRFSWYPGASHVGERTIRFENKDYFEVLRFLQFVT